MSIFTCLLLGVFLILLVIKVYVKLSAGWCKSNVCLVGKTAIVTGANTGIGYTSAEDFAKRGAKVILACRDPIRGKDAVEKIIRATNNENIIFKQLDLASLQSVREFAQDILKLEERLDILLNNAGALGLGPSKTNDGLLLIMATNYFGHFLLTNLLLDLMKKTPNSRIVNVSSRSAKRSTQIDVHNLNQYPEEGYGPDFKMYERTKICNILFTIELAERLKGTKVTTYSVHPGLIITEVFRNFPFWAQCLFKSIANYIFAKDWTEGAQTSIYCSVEKGIEDLSGEHFEDCHLVKRYPSATDPNLPKALWEVSEKLVNLNNIKQK